MSSIIICEDNEVYEFKSLYNSTLFSILENFKNDDEDETIITVTVVKKFKNKKL